MEKFSSLEHSFKRFEKEAESRSQLQAAKPFPDEMMTEAKRLHRLSEAAKNFWYFDKMYFPQEMYSDGYSAPAKFHKDIVKLTDVCGVNIIAGPRKHAKTGVFKKRFIYELLFDKLCYLGVGSGTLPQARNILSDFSTLIGDNPRIMHDFRLNIESDNSDEFSFYVPGISRKRIIQPFSEGRSVRSASAGFNRPEKMVLDDLETSTSPIGGTHTNERIRFISESFQSLTDNGVVICLGNNFNRSGYISVLLDEQKKGIIGKNWHVHVFKAWQNGKPLWKERYNAKTESELRAMLKPLDEAEWQGDFMQNPIPPDGFYFKRPHHEYHGALPADCKGVIFADPNISLTGKGDTTAIAILLHSAKTQKYYVPEVRCRSFSNSNELITTYFELYQKYKKYIFACGWDGNVNQEAVWTNFIKDWCTINKMPFPRVEYKRYQVDLLAKNARLAWDAGDILFREGLSNEDEGRLFLDQVFAFSGKKANKKDDAPDDLISLFQFIHERHLVKRKQSTASEVFTLTNSYSF